MEGEEIYIPIPKQPAANAQCNPNCPQGAIAGENTQEASDRLTVLQVLFYDCICICVLPGRDISARAARENAGPAHGLGGAEYQEHPGGGSWSGRLSYSSPGRQ